MSKGIHKAIIKLYLKHSSYILDIKKNAGQYSKNQSNLRNQNVIPKHFHRTIMIVV